MHLSLVFVLLVLVPIAVTNAKPHKMGCCFPEYFQGRKRLMVHNVDIYYRLDFEENLNYETYDAMGKTYNITDLTANKVYIVSEDGCKTEDFKYPGLFKRCFGAPDETVNYGHSSFSYPVKRYNVKIGGLTYMMDMQHRDGMCIPVTSLKTVDGTMVAVSFFYEYDSPFPPEMDVVKAMCS